MFACISLCGSLRATPAAKAIDRYIEASPEDANGKRGDADPRLHTIIEGIFKRCFAAGEYKQVVLHSTTR